MVIQRFRECIKLDCFNISYAENNKYLAKSRNLSDIFIINIKYFAHESLLTIYVGYAKNLGHNFYLCIILLPNQFNDF